MEVPYVDVLRTSSNPDLPLTQYEYEEFGNPAASPVEFETVMRLSPVDVAASASAAYDALFVVCRTFDNDQNVLAYESLKLVDALRSGVERSERGTRDYGGAKRSERGTRDYGGAKRSESGPRGTPRQKLVAVTRGQGHFSFGVAASLQRAEDFVLIMENLEK
jgi:hypothetical protein